MSFPARVSIWIAFLVAAVLLIWLLEAILSPFIVGLAVAYLLDPPVQRLERWGVSRAWAAGLVICLFFALASAAIILLTPVLQQQLFGMAERLIAGAGDVIEWARPRIDGLFRSAGMPEVADIGKTEGLTGKAVAWLGGLIAGLWSGGLALFNILSLAFLTPIIAFYMVRDWPLIVAKVDSWLPRDSADTIRDLLARIDRRLAGFVRGQAIVCLLLGIFYAGSLTIFGLSYGLVVGLLSGFLSFMPYVGTTIGMILCLAIATFQFGNWMDVGIVLGIYLVGQFIEGNFLQPVFVGDRVGLHPVWLILALMAGGALFGFVGVLLSVPVAAALGVLIRFALHKYLESSLYQGASERSGPVQT